MRVALTTLLNSGYPTPGVGDSRALKDFRISDADYHSPLTTWKKYDIKNIVPWACECQGNKAEGSGLSLAQATGMKLKTRQKTIFFHKTLVTGQFLICIGELVKSAALVPKCLFRSWSPSAYFVGSC